MMAWALVVAMVAPPVALAAESQSAERQTLVIAPLRALGVGKQETSILTDEIRTQAVRADRYTVVAPEEMKAINDELERQLAGGCDETSCIAEIGGALGAHFLITGTLGKLGKRYTINLKLIDIEKVRAVRTGNLRAERIEDLVGQLGDTVFALLGVAVKNRVSAGRGELEIHFSGPKWPPKVEVLFDGKKIGLWSRVLGPVIAQVPAGEGTLTLLTRAKIAELLPPANYPDAVIGLVQEGFKIQVPSSERLRLTAVLAYSQAWMDPKQRREFNANKRANTRALGRNLLLGGAALWGLTGVSIYQNSQHEDMHLGWLLTGVSSAAFGAAVGFAGYLNRYVWGIEPRWLQKAKANAKAKALKEAKARVKTKDRSDYQLKLDLNFDQPSGASP